MDHWGIKKSLHAWGAKRIELMRRLERTTSPEVRDHLEDQLTAVEKHIDRLQHVFMNTPGSSR